MNNYKYATLGVSCQTSLDVLTSNEKILSPYDKIYEELPAKMYRYPGSSHSKDNLKINRPEDIKKERNDIQMDENYPSSKSCCGKM